MNESFQRALKQLRGFGFFTHQKDEDILSSLDRMWGAESLEEAATTQEAEVMLLTTDRARVWYGDTKTRDEVGQYSELLHGLATISQGRFQPTELEESRELVSFRTHGHRYTYTPQPGHYLDTGILRIVNRSICGKAIFHVVDTLGMPNVMFMTTPSVKSALQTNLRWSFVDSLNQEKQGVVRGFLSTFWEQGMEEEPWLILQDKRFCDTPKKGWLREGMLRIGEGFRLSLVNQDNELLFEGILGDVSQSFWEKFRGKPKPLFPSHFPEEQWQSWFASEPPMRAHILPPQDIV